MYSPEKDELKRKLSHIATILVVVALIAFPVYLLVIKDDGGPQVTPRIDPDSPMTETRPMLPVPQDTLETQVRREERVPVRREEEPRIAAETAPRTRDREQPPPRPAPAPSLIGDDSLVFPQTPAQMNASRSYVIRNTGNSPLEIRNMSVSGANQDEFSLTQSGTIVVRPNDEAQIDIEFAPLASGERSAVLTIESNDPRRSPFRINLRGVAVGEEPVENIVRNLYEEGRRYFESRNFSNAEELYTNVLSLDPYFGPAYLMRGRTRYERGEYLAAISDFDNVLKYRLSIPSDDRQRVECISLYYAALSYTEQALRTENTDERDRMLRPAMGRWEDFKGICRIDPTLLENAGFWMNRISELR
jgi:hypothetical protein